MISHCLSNQYQTEEPECCLEAFYSLNWDILSKTHKTFIWKYQEICCDDGLKCKQHCLNTEHVYRIFQQSTLCSLVVDGGSIDVFYNSVGVEDQLGSISLSQVYF